MAIERRIQPSEQRENDEGMLEQVIPESEHLADRYYPKVNSKPNLAPLELPKSEQVEGEVHNQIDNHPLKTNIPEKERAATLEGLISGTVDGNTGIEFLQDNMNS
jgi:hypothetical protein